MFVRINVLLIKLICICKQTWSKWHRQPLGRCTPSLAGRCGHDRHDSSLFPHILEIWNRCCELNDSINVIKEMIDVRDEFKECQGFIREVEGFIEMLCIDWLFLTSLFLTKQSNFLCVHICFTIDKYYYYVFLKCVNKDIIIIIGNDFQWKVNKLVIHM